MNVAIERSELIDQTDSAVSRIAAAIGEPARTKILYCLMDGHARTSTELAAVAEVTPSTASVHLNRLKAENLVNVTEQGRHRYYSLAGPSVARALESLSVLAGSVHSKFVPHTPSRLRAARTCYDHMAGTIAVALHDRFLAMRWIETASSADKGAYNVTAKGASQLTALNVDVDALRSQRRRLAYPCLDWSERKPHIAGSLGAALLQMTLRKRWLARDFDSRALSITSLGKREMRARFDLEIA